MNKTILTGNKMYEKKELLKKVQVDVVNWKTYYLDENLNEKWVEEYTYPEMQAGGPPQLRLIEKFPWE